MGLSANKVSSNDDSDPSTPSLGNGAYKEPKEYIAVGQGFFVASDIDGGTIHFNNSQREFIKLGDKSIFFKTRKTKKEQTITPSFYNTDLPIIKLGLDYINDDAIYMHRQVGISFNQNNSFAYDTGYDSTIFDLGKTDIYWEFPNDDNKYIISGVQSISESLEVPLVIEMGYTGEITLTIDEWQKVDRDVFIKDKVTQQYYQINHKKATLFLEEAQYKDRFVLTFKTEDSLGNDFDKPNDNILIYYSQDQENIILKNIENDSLQKVYLYNRVGALIKTWDTFESASTVELPISKSAAGIYIVKVHLKDTMISKKILIP